jgi:hypothetical protein
VSKLQVPTNALPVFLHIEFDDFNKELKSEITGAGLYEFVLEINTVAWLLQFRRVRMNFFPGPFPELE